MKQTKKTTILFDFFGTLVAYTPDSYFAKKRQDTYRYLVEKGFSLDYDTFANLAQETYDTLRAEAVKTNNEFHMYQMMNLVLQQGFGHKIEQTFIIEATDVYLTEWMNAVTILPNIHSFLEDLSQSYLLGIISNTNMETLVPTVLKKFQMESYFSHITTSIGHGKRKPDPTIFQDTLALMKKEPDEVIFVGDSYEADYLGAKKLGIHTLLIDPENRYPELGEQRIPTLFDLPRR